MLPTVPVNTRYLERWLDHCARLTTPANFRVLEIGSDYLLGVATDDLGIERVQLRALEGRKRR